MPTAEPPGPGMGWRATRRAPQPLWAPDRVQPKVESALRGRVEVYGYLIAIGNNLNGFG
jgi:hypothetical protein